MITHPYHYLTLYNDYTFIPLHFCGNAGSAEFLANHLKLCRNCAFSQNFHTRKPGGITVFYAVYAYSRNIVLAVQCFPKENVQNTWCRSASGITGSSSAYSLSREIIMISVTTMHSRPGTAAKICLFQNS